MTKRLLLGYLTITVLVLVLLEVPLALFYSQRELDRLTTGVERDATVIASIYEDDLQIGRSLDPGAATLYASRTGARVVVTDARGIALIDTEQTVPRDFSTRPEIATALTGRRAAGTRSSTTLGSDFVYVAIPVTSSGVVHGAVRLTLATSHVDSHIHRFWLGLVLIAATVLAVMTLVGLVIAHGVTLPIRRLQVQATRFARGDLTPDEQVTAGPPELRELSDTMSTMAIRLAALIDEQRAFVADASHQLRTPLTALRLRLENLQARLPEADAAELDNAIDETTRLAGLVSDLLQLARADHGQPAAPTDIADIARQRVDTWSALAESRGVTLQLVADDAPVVALAQPGSVEQVLDNTLDNALTVLPDGGVITVTVIGGTSEHRLIISDNGPGLPDADKERATRRFWRAADAAPGAGTGLGLAIASALAHASGGDLTLGDAPPHGLAVTLTLPAS